MFNKQSTKQPNSFDEKLKAAKYDCILQALKEIVKMEVKGTDAAGKETINPVATCSSMKTRARLALEFVANLDKDGDDN